MDRWQSLLDTLRAEAEAELHLERETGPSLLAELLNSARPRWQRDALCREYPDVSWFPERGGNGREARAICARCLVRDECRDYAIEHHEHGIWGDTDARERTALRRPHAA